MGLFVVFLLGAGLYGLLIGFFGEGLTILMRIAFVGAGILFLPMAILITFRFK